MSDKLRIDGATLYEGVKEIIHSVDMETMLWNAATDVISGLDADDYDISIVPIGRIEVARIDIRTKKAEKDNWDNNTLLKALGEYKR